MGKFTKLDTILYPDLNVVYTNYGVNAFKNQNISMLKNIKQKFGTYIEKWGNLLEIDSSVLICFIAIESNGKEGLKPNGAEATGLCQVTPVAVRETISKFKTITKNQLSPEILNYINSKTPYLTALTPSKQDITATQKKQLLELLTNDAEYNILMGAISLRWLFEYLKYDGKAHLNRAIIGYNQSAYGRISAYKNKKVTTQELYTDTKIPKETRNYLAKLLGVDGFSSLTIENKIY